MVQEDLPFTKLQQLFNVNFTIVSQVSDIQHAVYQY